MVPALAADPGTGRLVLTTYRETDVGCCGLVAEVASSRDDGTTWTVRRASVRPLQQDWLAPALGGSFVGDYTATVFAGATAVSVLPLAEPPAGSACGRTCTRSVLTSACTPATAAGSATTMPIRISAHPLQPSQPSRSPWR